MQTRQQGSQLARLLDRAQHGDAEAFAKIAEPLSPRLLSIARSVVGNREDAEDVVQESLWKAFEHLPEYRAEAALSAWMIRITLNQAIARLRHRRTDPLCLSTPTAEMDKIDFAHCYGCAPAPTPEETCSIEEIREIFRQCLARMDPAYSQPLYAVALGGLRSPKIYISP